jgi:hypothetical protein
MNYLLRIGVQWHCNKRNLRILPDTFYHCSSRATPFFLNELEKEENEFFLPVKM